MKLTLKCDVCNKEFARNKAEVTRSLKLGRRQFCSSFCFTSVNKDNLGIYLGAGRPENLKRKYKRKDHSEFLFFLRKARSRHKKKGGRNLS
jgi:hypothetical protein